MKNGEYIQYSRIFHTFAWVKTLAESPCPIMRCCLRKIHTYCHKITVDNHVIICYSLIITKKGVILMQWILPGTVLQSDTCQADKASETFAAMFLAGDLQLGQVCAVTGLEPYIIQNWVRRGYLSPPVNKKYSLNQLCRILNINLLRGCFPLETICTLLSYVNGRLDEESDDLIDDNALYGIFVKLAASVKNQRFDLETAIAQSLENLPERMPGANERIQKALKAMLLAWVSGELRAQAAALTDEMERMEH